MIKFLKKLFGIKDRLPPEVGSKWKIYKDSDFCVVIQEVKDGWVRHRYQDMNPWNNKMYGIDNYTTLERFYRAYGVQVKE